jgi:hypothetical protein
MGSAKPENQILRLRVYDGGFKARRLQWQCGGEEGGSNEKAQGSRQESGKNSEIESRW